MDVGIVFTGQGSQRIGMAKDFHDEFELTKNVFETVSEAVQLDVASLCFEENENINFTENTQPALLAVEIGIYEVLKKEHKLIGNYFAGHSLGEYSALTASGTMQLADTAKIVRKRGSLMQQARTEEKSGMSALLCEDIEKTDYRSILKEEDVEIANLNSKDQVVISGLRNSIDKAKIKLNGEMQELTIVDLNVNTPFHSSFMKSIESDFREFLSGFEEKFNSKNSETVLSNFTGKLYRPSELIDNLVKQLSGSVKWINNMQEMLKLCEKIYEVGPSRVLGTFFASLDAQVKSIMNLRSMQKAFR